MSSSPILTLRVAPNWFPYLGVVHIRVCRTSLTNAMFIGIVEITAFSGSGKFKQKKKMKALSMSNTHTY